MAHTDVAASPTRGEVNRKSLRSRPSQLNVGIRQSSDAGGTAALLRRQLNRSLSPPRTGRSLSPGRVENTEDVFTSRTSIGSRLVRIPLRGRDASPSVRGRRLGSPVTRCLTSSCSSSSTAPAEGAASPLVAPRTDPQEPGHCVSPPAPVQTMTRISTSAELVGDSMLEGRRCEDQRKQFYEELASQLKASSLRRSMAGTNGKSSPSLLSRTKQQPSLTPSDVQLQREWSTVLQQVLSTNASRPTRSVATASSPCFSGCRSVDRPTVVPMVNLQGLDAAELGMSLLSSSCGRDCDSSTTLPSPRSTPASTPRSYVTFSAPAGKLFSWRDVAVHTDDAFRVASPRSTDAGSTISSQGETRGTAAQAGYQSKGISAVPTLRLDMLKLPTVVEPADGSSEALAH